MTYPARQGRPDTTYDHHVQDGTLVTVRSDADGVVRPTTPDEVALCDARGMNVVPASPRRSRTPTDSAPADPAKED